jgi:hypothetical protein
VFQVLLPKIAYCHIIDWWQFLLLFCVLKWRALTLLVIWVLQFMPVLRLLIVATLGITNDVDGGFVTDNTTRHYKFIILTFVYSSTCFGCFTSHHQELNYCSDSLWFYLRIVVTVVLCLCSGWLTGPTTNTARLSPRCDGQIRGCHCSHWAPDDGRENTRNMLRCKQSSG